MLLNTYIMQVRLIFLSTHGLDFKISQSKYVVIVRPDVLFTNIHWPCLSVMRWELSPFLETEINPWRHWLPHRLRLAMIILVGGNKGAYHFDVFWSIYI